MLNSPRSASPTSPTPELDSRSFQCLYFCRFPGCNKGYASTDGVRKHCRKHHADWLAEIDAQMKDSGSKHSAANYCSTQPADPAPGEFAALSHARKRPRADSGSSYVSTPYHTPRLDPSVPRRAEPSEVREFAIDEQRPAPQPVRIRRPTKEDIFPVFSSITEDLPHRPTEAVDRPLLAALAAMDEPARLPNRSSRERCENFFSLSSGMPIPKRGYSLTADAMAELAQECELDAQKTEPSFSELADLNSFFREEPTEPTRDSVGFLSHVWA